MMSGQLAVTEWGPPEAEPVVLLHGFMGRAADWEPVAQRLGERWRVIGMDLPGHGRSVGLPDACYTLSGAVEAVAATLDALGVSRTALVGYSMGGRVAYHVAMATPGRLSALVVESAHPGLGSEPARRERRRMDALRAGQIATDPRGFLEQWYTAPFFGGVADDPAVRAALIEHRLRGASDEWGRALVGLGTGTQEPVGERLGSLGVPTLLVTGERDDRYITLLAALASRTGFPLHVEPGAGHAVHVERPGAFAAVVASFLDSSTQSHQPCP